MGIQRLLEHYYSETGKDLLGRSDSLEEAPPLVYNVYKIAIIQRYLYRTGDNMFDY